MKYIFAAMAWGEHHVKMFLEVGLPSQLASGNLRDFPGLVDSIYQLYTTEDDRVVIAAHPLFGVLLSLLPVEIRLVDKEIGPSKWATVRHCHREQVKSADARDAALFFLCADQCWSAGSFQVAASKLGEGYDAVVCAGPRASAAPVIGKLALARGAEGTLEISGRRLVQLLLEHPHPETVSWFWDDLNYFQYPTYIYFAVPGEGIVAFCYIMHPVVVKPRVKNAPFHKVFDQDWLSNACPDPSRIYVVQSSDEVCQLELSPRDMELPSQPSNPHLDPIQAMTWYAEATYNLHHRVFARQPVYLIASREATPAKWNSVLVRGLRVIEAVAAGLDLPDLLLLHLNPENLMRRINMRNWYSDMPAADKLLLEYAHEALELHVHRPPWVPPVREP